ncbi:MAG: hypothetical protein JKY30_02070 [Flavobacteriales bacterium]|nr:hypothetical protein [Flavobacteriales bacterium]
MNEFLESITNHSTIALAIVGIIFIGLSLTKSIVKLPNGTEVNSPEKAFPRIVLGTLGLIMGILGIYAFAKTPDGDYPLQKQLTSSYAYFKLSGNEEDCANGKCKVTLLATGLFEVPKGVKAEFENRVSTNGRILEVQTVPDYVALNRAEFQKDSTTLFFKLSPPENDSGKLKIQARVLVDHCLTPEYGKIGLYLPYYTKYSAIIVDFSELEFEPKYNLEPRILANMGQGKMDMNYITPDYKFWNKDKIVIVYAEKIPEKSSIIIKWGYE